MDSRLDGKRALVTGAFGGLGRAFAGMLARAGASVALAGRRIAEGRACAAELAAGGANAIAVAMDVTDRASTERAVSSLPYVSASRASSSSKTSESRFTKTIGRM